MKKNILFIYSYASYPMRSTTWEHLRCFQNYASDSVYYLNLALKDVPWYVGTVDFDLIIFHTLFLTNHWGGADYYRNVLMKKVEQFKKSKAVKVMLPQDEFYFSDLYCEFINDFGIDIVFSVAPSSTWRKIYRSVDFNKVRFFNVLTGYLDDNKSQKIVEMGKSLDDRPIDIGYRVSGKPYYWFGRHGFLKNQIAEKFIEKASQKGLKIDISTRDDDAILGDDWYRFLARSKYTMGVEGGTSMIDPDGTIRQRTEAYLKEHPGAPPFEEVEAACFPGVDGSCNLFAISPRHLEVCATRTCQILTEGEYNGILKPGKHYIELKKDLSNLDKVLDMIKQDHLRREMVENAYQNIVASSKYTYNSFVNFVINKSLEGKKSRWTKYFPWVSLWQCIVYWLMTRTENAEWQQVKRNKDAVS